ncbi:rhodanese-like domain-containing protein [Pseudomaricurvus sp. HS19]|uniref:rhodanese-like domain-containing protein n=1 Tax=Pseudomaricurvus sp. HS19 TaxID=2692626 RepID=UPI001370D485|nr:rhodanese-like domain-containing protein [Pseudomaricurvus sp. HS19]MYM62663.1 rhodanese-like domain-containing protein [Pseudomaricurvus sp. HS19]
MPVTKGCQQLIAEARARITTLTLEQAAARLQDPETVFVDIRDVRELEREGLIPSALHAPRGMLEFWVDPDSPYFKPVFAEPKTFVLYCQSAWRSSLATATLLDMGMTNVCHFDGGFKAWKAAGLPTEERQRN